MILVCRMFETAYIATSRDVQSRAMYESVRGRAKRVLVIGESAGSPDISPETLLAPDGLLIVMESDTARAAEMRRGFANHRPEREGHGHRRRATADGVQAGRAVRCHRLRPGAISRCARCSKSCSPRMECSSRMIEPAAQRATRLRRASPRTLERICGAQPDAQRVHHGLRG